MTFPRANYNGAAPSFVTCGKARADMKLGDLVANEAFANSASAICFVTAGNANAKVEFEGEMQEASYVYWLEEWSPAQGEGWYLGVDGSATVNCNDVPIPFGDGFLVQCAEGSEEGQDDVAALSFAGEVQKTEVTKTFARIGFNCLGNCTPRPLTLGDITADQNFADSTSAICFMTAGNANAKVEFDGEMQEESYVYWPAEWSPEQGAGWYLGVDGTATMNCNSRPLRAGEGFMVQCSDGAEKDGEMEASITIPAAYEEKKSE